MKILKLKALNINSLKGETQIDFRTFLNDNALFAITGPTGAGKSTILDIITCALYGRTPRLKNPNELMARHTGECYCEVEFEIKGIVYRSSWTQKRARKNADGKFQSAKMELSDVNSAKVLKATLRDVPKYVEELSGLDFDRFKQSMVLAQGGFDAFLKADEKERSTLLEKMTGTQIYKQISLEIYEQYTSYKSDIELDKKILDTTELLDSKEVEEKDKALEENKTQKKLLDTQEKELIQIKTWIETLDKLVQEEKNYNELYTSSVKEKEDSKEQFKSLALANKALNIQSTYQEYNNIETTIITQKEKLIVYNEQYKLVSLELNTKNTIVDTLKKEYEKEKISFEQNSLKLKDIRAFKEQINSKVKLQGDIDNKLYSQKKELSKLLNVELSYILEDEEYISTAYREQKEKISSLYSSLEICEKEYSTIESYLSQRIQKEESYRASLKRIDQIQNTIVEYEKLLIDIHNEKELSIKLTKQLEVDTTLQVEKIKLIEQIKLTIQTLMQKKDNELLIAKYEDDRKKLHEDEPCYLCGSKVHPYITHSIEINTDKTTLQIAEQQSLLTKENESLKIYENKLLLNNKKAEDTLLELTKLDNTKEQIEQFFKNTNFTLELNAKVELEEEKDNLEKQIKEITILREKKETLLKEKEKLQKQYHLVQEQEIQIQAILKAFEENKNELNKLIPAIETLIQKSKTILDVDDIEQYEKNITDKYSMIQTKYNDASKELITLISKEEFLTTQIKELKIKQNNDEVESKKLKAKFDNELVENDFNTKIDFENAILPKEKREELILFCNSIDEKYNRYKTLQIDTRKKLNEHKKEEIKVRPFDEVIQELKELNEKIDEIQKNIGSSEKELEINTQNRKKNEEKIEELEKKKEKFKVWVKLNEMIGSADGNKFAKFAQGITLDQLINLANNHLTILSSRYELQRSTEQKQLLEIEVIDSFQGDVIRPVSTLSGGESFIVSLSLALGLSELASQKISIDSLFLDEGFGTLDEDSLETALNALNLLQSRGKMVGVISHVEALKERIPLQIKVIPKGDGTSVIEMD
ncbi:AAA family ATPase [Arcobacteraceae bacterium]|nr:AAA family ATPase [Arcobacteraceae bacterium]